jgi:4-carboxymuconolactone decarboxylase
VALIASGTAANRDEERIRTVPDIQQSTQQALAGISAGKLETLEGALGLREEYRVATGLDERTSALVKIAALIALDAPPASYAWQMAAAVEAGVSGEDILGVLRAVAPQVGGPRVVAAAPEIMLALGLSLPEGNGGE